MGGMIPTTAPFQVPSSKVLNHRTAFPIIGIHVGLSRAAELCFIQRFLRTRDIQKSPRAVDTILDSQVRSTAKARKQGKSH